MVWLSGVAGGQVLKAFILQAFGDGTVDSGSTSGGSSPPPPAIYLFINLSKASITSSTEIELKHL